MTAHLYHCALCNGCAAYIKHERCAGSVGYADAENNTYSSALRSSCPYLCRSPLAWG